MFQPERQDFDDLMNAMLLQEGIQCWEFTTNSVLTRDPETTATIIDKLARVVPINVLLENLASDITNKQITRIDEDWADMPLPIALAKLQASALGGAMKAPGAAPAPAPAAKTIGGVPVAKSQDELVQWLIDRRDDLLKDVDGVHRLEIMRENQPRDIVLAVSGETMRDLTTPG